MTREPGALSADKPTLGGLILKQIDGKLQNIGRTLSLVTWPVMEAAPYKVTFTGKNQWRSNIYMIKIKVHYFRVLKVCNHQEKMHISLLRLVLRMQNERPMPEEKASCRSSEV